MSLRTKAKAVATRLIDHRGYAIIPKHLAYDWQTAPALAPSHSGANLTDDQMRYLRPDNPVLLDLQARYDAFDKTVTAPLVWNSDQVTAEDIKYFRGDNAYRWQLRGRDCSYVSYVISTYYLRTIDKLDLFSRLEEDDEFGNFTFNIDGTVISSEILGAISELNFLDRHLQISTRQNVKILDIGAGYGRLAHRAIASMPNIASYCCTDGVAVSSFLCDYYLRYRGVGPRAKAVFLDQVQDALSSEHIDLAINTYSFSECRVEAIDWWVSNLARHSVPYVFIAPNGIRERGAVLSTNDGIDFSDILTRHGYRLKVREPQYHRPEVQELGFCPTHYHLFER